MPNLATTEDLAELIRRSGLLSEGHIRETEPPGDRVESPEAWARRLVKARLLTPFQARSLLQGRHRGFFLARKYKVLDIIGEGGMGRVLLCEHLLLNRLVAVKLLHAASVATPGAADRFLREAQAAAALDHPNIARVFDADKIKDLPFMVMEYVDGKNLHQFVNEHGPLPASRAAEYIRQAATGLQHAHDHGQVHRDIKPSNLLLERSGVVKLLDLGLVRFFDPRKNANLTQRFDDKAVLGTADFIAPEQAMDSSTVDPRADIYSLGYTLYYLLTSHVPFEEASAPQKLLFHQLREPKSLRELRPDLPEEMIEAFSRMTRKDPAHRCQSAREVAELFAGFADPKTALPTADEMPKHRPSAYLLGLAPLEAAPNYDATPPVIRLPQGDSAPTTRNRSTHAADSSPTRPPSSSDIVLARLPQTNAKPLVPLDPTLTSPALHAVEPAPSRLSRPRKWALGLVISLVLMMTGLMAWFSASEVEANKVEVPAPPLSGPIATPNPPPDPPETVTITIQGGGSTFIKPLMDLWIEKYRDKSDTAVTYDGGGSSSGIQRVTYSSLNFGCSDAPLTDEQLRAAYGEGGEVIHIPLIMGAVVPTYNLPGLTRPLVFPGSLLADIYLGKITRWNHESIQLNNPGVQLPDLPITLVRRSDGSGTTYIWTEYLRQVSDEWRRSVGVSTQPKWPTDMAGKPLGLEGKGNDGVAQEVKNCQGAIGYVELTYALKNNLPAGWVVNREGKATAPTIKNVTAAAAALLKGPDPIPDDLRYSLTFGPGANSYPISGTTWAVLYVKQPAAVKDKLVAFLWWITHDGQVFAKDLKCASIPSELLSRIEEKLSRVTTK